MHQLSLSSIFINSGAKYFSNCTKFGRSLSLIDLLGNVILNLPIIPVKPRTLQEINRHHFLRAYLKIQRVYIDDVSARHLGLVVRDLEYLQESVVGLSNGCDHILLVLQYLVNSGQRPYIFIILNFGLIHQNRRFQKL